MTEHDEPTRRRFMGRMTRKRAETAAKTFAGAERDKIDKAWCPGRALSTIQFPIPTAALFEP